VISLDRIRQGKIVDPEVQAVSVIEAHARLGPFAVVHSPRQTRRRILPVKLDVAIADVQTIFGRARGFDGSRYRTGHDIF